MERRYRDAEGVVHIAADLAAGNNITLCERDTGDEFYDTRELKLTENATTCLRCLVAPDWLRQMTST